MSEDQRFFAACPTPFEGNLAEELLSCNASAVEIARGGVRFTGSLVVAYRACLWSRVASRVLFPIAEVEASSSDAFYSGIRDVTWTDHIAKGRSVAIDVVAVSSAIQNTHFAKLRAKDAIVDSIRDRQGWRPNIAKDRPDVRINIFAEGDNATVSIDLSGESLHRRGYRSPNVQAPLKENLAAGLLLLAGWPDRAKEGQVLCDLMCGSGTFLIEAAMMALDYAPGFFRAYNGFDGWMGHAPEVWDELLQEARERRRQQPEGARTLFGYDVDQATVHIATQVIERLGFSALAKVEQRALVDSRMPDAGSGLVVINPPYGRRLGSTHDLDELYSQLGQALKRCFNGWDAYVLSGDSELTRLLELKASAKHKVRNGAIECRWLHYPIRRDQPGQPGGLKSDSEQFHNRLKKRCRHLHRWAERNQITCYRAYDADIPQFAVAIDRYEEYACVQEYAPPTTVKKRLAQMRLRQVMEIVPEVLGIPKGHVYLKVRRPQRKSSQYRASQGPGEIVEVREGGCRFLVNLGKYIDTGLFLEQRLLRRLIGRLASGGSFLNLFGYTGSATVYAAKGGATSSTTVDLSRTYLSWAQRNFELNGLRKQAHRLQRADCLTWIAQHKRHYDLVFLAPPTFSNSKSMESTFEVQRDHVSLLREAGELLSPQGTLLFSNNYRRFVLNLESLQDDFVIEDLTKQLLPEDFKHKPKIQHTWRLAHRSKRLSSHE